MALSKLSRNKRFNYSKNGKNIRRRALSKKRRQRNLGIWLKSYVKILYIQKYLKLSLTIVFSVKLTEEAKALAHHWNESKGLKENMAELGLVADCSKAIPIQKTTWDNEIFLESNFLNSLKESAEAPKAERTEQQKQVHKILEDIAANEDHKEWDVSQEDIHFAVHMFDKHDLVCTSL